LRLRPRGAAVSGEARPDGHPHPVRRRGRGEPLLARRAEPPSRQGHPPPPTDRARGGGASERTGRHRPASAALSRRLRLYSWRLEVRRAALRGTRRPRGRHPGPMRRFRAWTPAAARLAVAGGVALVALVAWVVTGLMIVHSPAYVLRGARWGPEG